MRRFLYYISPFIMVPATLFLGDFIVRATKISMFFPYFFIVPILLSFIIGIFTPTHKKFDSFMAVMMPLSLFCFMFIVGYLDEDDLVERFQLDRAFETALQVGCLIEYCCMAIVAFLSSHQKIRTRLQKSSGKFEVIKKDKL